MWRIQDGSKPNRGFLAEIPQNLPCAESALILITASTAGIGEVPMRSIRRTRSFSLDPDVLSEVERTKGSASASERVNHLLRYALEIERKAGLYQEAAEFFATASDDREECRAFQEASLRTWTRE
jgi:hypothetical protein